MIQIIDSGCGMSQHPIRICSSVCNFKIRSASDIFAIRTMVSGRNACIPLPLLPTVGLRTREHDKELGTFIHFGVGNDKTEAVNDAGTIHNKICFQCSCQALRRIRLSCTSLTKYSESPLLNPEISAFAAPQRIRDLRSHGLNKRVTGSFRFFRKQIRQNLVAIDTETTLAKISGFGGPCKIFAKNIRRTGSFHVIQRL